MTRKNIAPRVGAIKRQLNTQAAAAIGSERPASSPVNCDLPTLDVSNKPLRDRSNEALDVLIRANTPPFLYQRGGIIVWLKGGSLKVATVDDIRGRLTRVANFERRVGRSDPTVCDPQEDVIRDLLSCQNSEESFPSVSGVTEWPILTQSGKLIVRGGYDPETRLIYVPRDKARLRVPTKPNSKTIQEALSELQEIFVDFPFAEDGSLANALGALLTVLFRPAIIGPVPMFAIDAATVGAGKTLLAQAIFGTASGRHVAATPECFRDEEWSKTITGVVSEGCPFLLIDNVSEPVVTPLLAAFATASEWKARLLGTNSVPSIPHQCVVALTGNNLRMSPDIARRICLIRLDPQMYRPASQALEFLHPDLLGWIKSERVRLQTAAFTLARAWFAAGCPEPQAVPPLGGFESWRKLIGGVLEFAGVSGLLQNRSTVDQRGQADGSDEVADFVYELALMKGDTPFTAGELAADDDLLWGQILPSGLTRNARALGKFFQKIDGKRLQADGLRIERLEKRRHNACLWHFLRDPGKAREG